MALRFSIGLEPTTLSIVIHDAVSKIATAVAVNYHSVKSHAAHADVNNREGIARDFSLRCDRRDVKYVEADRFNKERRQAHSSHWARKV